MLQTKKMSPQKQSQDPEIHTSSYYCVPSGGAILGEGRQPQHGVLGVHWVRPRDLQQDPKNPRTRTLPRSATLHEQEMRRGTSTASQVGYEPGRGGRALCRLRRAGTAAFGSRPPGGRAPPSAIHRGRGGVGARTTGEGARDRQGGSRRHTASRFWWT
jgi:hypothetical protein